MPKYSKKEFADLVGIKTKHLSTQIARGKVVCVGDLIDGEHPTNKYFIDRQAAFIEKKKLKTEPAAAAVVETISEEDKLNARSADKKTEAPQPKFDFPPADTPVSENYKLDSEIKKINIQKTTNEVLLQQAKIDKLTGESIPTQLVRNLFLHHNKSITVAFRNGTENFLMQIAKKAGMDRTILTEMRKTLVDVINKAVIDSIEESKKGLANVIAEYSKKKEVGERE